MTTPKEQWEEEFDKKFCTEQICKGCHNSVCDYSTTGCPWRQSGVLLNKDGGEVDTAEQIKDFIRTTRAAARIEGLQEALDTLKDEYESVMKDGAEIIGKYEKGLWLARRKVKEVIQSRISSEGV